MRHPLDGHRRAQPRTGIDDDELRRHRSAATEHRVMDAVRAGHGEPEFARLRGDVSGRVADRGDGQLAKRVPARNFPGHSRHTKYTDVEELIANIENKFMV